MMEEAEYKHDGNPIAMTNCAPIGVFDSGVGGLTVVRALREELPQESLVYLGDTARVPYGTKSPEVVERYALNCARFLVEQGAKAIVIACNTASAVAVEVIESALAVPVMGVITPGAEMAVTASRGGRIGVIGTEGTLRSGRYQEAILRQAPKATVRSAACPLFVPLAEEGMAQHPVTRMLAEEYLAPMLEAGIDTLVLGCTHYPLLEGLLREVAGDEVQIINSATAVARSTRRLLERRDLLCDVRTIDDQLFATDVGERFARVGSAFLGAPIDRLQWVDL